MIGGLVGPYLVYLFDGIDSTQTLSTSRLIIAVVLFVIYEAAILRTIDYIKPLTSKAASIASVLKINILAYLGLIALAFLMGRLIRL